MKKLLQITILVFLAVFWLMIGLSYADGTCGVSGKTGTSPFTANSASYVDVNACVNTHAARGETINVPAGTATWSSRLDITKAIKLIGAGKGTGGTKIIFAWGTVNTDTCGDCNINYGTAGGWGSIKYKPTDPQADENEEFVVTGFRFEQSPTVYRVGGIQIVNCSVNYPLRKVKIYNNDFIWRSDSGGQQFALMLNFAGYVYGVAYDNVFDGRHPYFYLNPNSLDATMTAQGNGCSYYAGRHAIQNATYQANPWDTFYYEDNTFYYRDMSGSHFGGTAFGGSMTIRYNSMYFYDADREYQNGWQTHGAYWYTTGGLEFQVYGNYFNGTSTSSLYRQSIMFCRSGRCLGWGNLFTATGTELSPFAEIHHECDESVTSPYGHACPTGTKYPGANACTLEGQPQHPYNSYFFRNFYGASGNTLATAKTLSYGDGNPAGVGCADNPGTEPRINTDFWMHDPDHCNSLGCTVGVGCGATLPPTCALGTGFWLTSDTAGCSGLTTSKTGAGGVLATKKQQGGLYRCGPTINTWTLYYEPAQYPHPLRTDIVDTDPSQYVAGTSTPTSPVGSPVECVTDPQDQVIGFTVTENSGSTVYCRYCDASAATTYVFPLKVNALGYLEDQNDVPFFIQGDSPWFSMIKGTQEMITQYLDDRQARGFNALIMDLIEDDDGGPVNAYGEVPFTTPGDFSTSNMATNDYWTHADWIINQAAARGMVVFLFPAYIGASAAKGFQDELVADTELHITAYGTAVGERYEDFPNIVWVMGGDADAGMIEGLIGKHSALAAAIKAADSNHIMTAHTKEGYDALNDYDEEWLDLNTVHWSDYETKTCNTGTAQNIKENGYDKLETLPFVFFEGLYENTTTPASGATDLCTRSQAYWAVLGGSPGYFFGNYPLYAFATGWSTAMADDGSRAMNYMGNLMRSRSWHLLVPDYANEVVTSGFGNIANATYAASARTSDGATIIVYIPVGLTTITVDMTKITDAGGLVYAWWYNPSTGVATYISQYANTGSRQFTSATGDWVLVLDSVAADLGTPGDVPTSAACNANTTYAQMPAANAFTNTNLVQTVTIEDQACSNSYLYYGRCIDPSGNESDPIIISYSVDTDDDTTAPEIVIFRLDSNGRDLYLTADEPIKVGSGGSGGFVLTKNGTDAVDLTFGAIIDRTIRYQTAIPILSTDTLAIVYTQPTAGIQDLSDNDLENISSTTVVNDSRPEAEASATLFDQTSTPTYSTATSPNPVNLGVRFQSTQIGRLEEICFYKDAGMDGETHVGTVYDSTGAVLRTHTFVDETESGWQCEELSSHLGILNDVNYTVAVFYPSNYIYTRDFFTTAYTNSDEILTAGDFNGRYVYAASSTYPVNVAAMRPNYWVDFIMAYQDVDGPWEVDISKTGDGCTYTPTENQVVEDGGSTTVSVTLRNGWKASWGGTCVGTATGNDYYVANITADCTVELTCSEILLMPWRLVP